MATFYEFRTLTAALVFDLTDAFARQRGTRGRFPRPFEPIRFLATARTGINPQVFDPPLELIVHRNGNGYHVFRNMIKKKDDRVKADTVIRGALAEGTYNFRVESKFYQRGELLNVTVPQPKAAAHLDLLPAYNYPFPMDLKPTGGRGFALLRGSLHTSAGIPIETARVEAAGASNPYITDNTGQWVLVFPDSAFQVNQNSLNVTVVVTPEGGPSINVPNVTVDKGAERALSESALRGWVMARGLGVPAATVKVQGHPGDARTSFDGSWFYYFAPDHSSSASVDVTAELPDGTTQTRLNQQVQPRATVVVLPFQFP